MTFQVYKPEYNPMNLTGQVGGDIGAEVFSGYIGELFYHVTTPPSGVSTTEYQYRKVHIKNTYTSTSEYTRVWLDAVEHPDQIAICPASGLDDSTSTPTGEPLGVTGWRSPSNYSEGISLGTMTTNSYTGVWVRQALSGITSPDPYATFRLYVGGVV